VLCHGQQLNHIQVIFCNGKRTNSSELTFSAPKREIVQTEVYIIQKLLSGGEKEPYNLIETKMSRRRFKK
jgi:hypothetical protein